MADKSTQLILGALSRAAASPDGAPLFAARGGPGLFPATAAGKQAAQRCQDEGWLRSPPTRSRGPVATRTTSGGTAVLVHHQIQSGRRNRAY